MLNILLNIENKANYYEQKERTKNSMPEMW